jgi:hypothetical protein
MKSGSAERRTARAADFLEDGAGLFMRPIIARKSDNRTCHGGLPGLKCVENLL